MKANPHVSGDILEYIAEQNEKDPIFRETLAAEFDTLQLARTIRQLRESRQLSQEKLASLVGTKQPSIARLERGKSVPNLSLLHKIASVLGTRLDLRFLPVS